MIRKEFDCVEMMHRGQALVRKRLKGMSDEEKLDYWRIRAEELRKRRQELRRSKTASSKRN